LEKNFNAIFCKHKKWPWQIREIDNKNFIVRFPPWKSVSKLIDFPAFDLENAGVNVKIVAWDGDCEPLAVLPVAWMLVKGLPPKKCAFKTFAQVASSVGVLMDVDWSSFFRSFYDEVRLQVACRDPLKFPRKGLWRLIKNFTS
jgi:hypothetical protein